MSSQQSQQDPGGGISLIPTIHLKTSGAESCQWTSRFGRFGLSSTCAIINTCYGYALWRRITVPSMRPFFSQRDMKLQWGEKNLYLPCQRMQLLVFLGFFLCIFMAEESLGIRLPERISEGVAVLDPDRPLKMAVFALGSFWRSEAVFGCLPGVVRTTVGYAGGTKTNPEFRSLGDHAESVQIEYDPKLIQYKQLLDVFWSSHDSRQVFGQGPDVGNQYRSIIFTNGIEEARLASTSKEREQTKMRSTIVTTQIQQLGTFYPAESDHQKFELKRNPFILQLIGNMPDEELTRSSMATKLNSYSAELCPPKIQKQIDAKINDILRKGWPVLKEV